MLTLIFIARITLNSHIVLSLKIYNILEHKINFFSFDES